MSLEFAAEGNGQASSFFQASGGEVFERITAWLFNRSHRTAIGVGLLVIALMILALSFLRSRLARPVSGGGIIPNDPREAAFADWWSGNPQDRQKLITSRSEVCPNAPFLLPAQGYIGLLYGDPRGPYGVDHRHQGIDIFSPTGPNQTPVVAAYDGYLTREQGWHSAVIMRVPDDPLQPGRQIWLYYTHMADPSGLIDYVSPGFPQGTKEVFVRQGSLLGHTGDYSGDPLQPVGVHLHFSIVLDNGLGGYRNELVFDNTVDPSRYLGIAVNYGCAPVVPDCDPNPLCAQAVLGDGGA
jgi:murein DD-endopeptidase MepM/ murein hydrolase activator NlpD